MLPGGLSPTAEAGLARLSAWMPFGPAAEHLAFFWGVGVSKATARRHAEAVGAAYVGIQAAELEHLVRANPAPGVGPAVQQVSADGAMVPLVGGTWTEVKTVAVGTVTVGPANTVHTTALSYLSRRADQATFTRLAEVELHRRGTATAGVVVGVMDGAEWLQRFLDYHRPDAVRVLDFPHALEHLGTAARACFGPGTTADCWLTSQADALKHGAPSATLVALLELPTATAANPAAAVAARDATFHYLARRLEQLRYAEWVALGYPIGSGAVESANKLVVEVRLKGSGMHWQPANVDPMLALRNLACNQRWDEAWPLICAQLQATARARRAARRQTRADQRAGPPAPPPTSPTPPTPAPAPASPARPKLVVAGRPTANHPWKRAFLAGGRAKAAS